MTDEQASADLIPSDAAVIDIQARDAEYTQALEFQLAIIIHRLEEDGEVFTLTPESSRHIAGLLRSGLQASRDRRGVLVKLSAVQLELWGQQALPFALMGYQVWTSH